ncbi:tRNA (adenosine(37)-N6)-dimethylallyltransferase MiaA [Piscinibacter sp. Jin2]|uniref:tRNA dimethylallyltransferase n=1 Tax=Aquariibacter lacus TaxID=2801332 RepID=A0A9X1BR33_9BURK|nr:tRNA (adenosine(37)-N6)-dimethylallyltransferase MiaA [Piscinibacter lacus]MBL0720301.1 tRNA (adenosine(37)-N6)-dimethylallyltransferase MiaA [Piscinibacter lacus]
MRPGLRLALAGPTASGKTAAALALAARLRARHGLAVEIVSVDSALVYRGMDCGTAKPSAAERAAVPHHLIDVIDPAEPFSAARFVAEAQAAMADIAARGALPLLVGGTMLYFKALFDGLDELPPADPALRAQIEAEAAARGWPALHAELAAVDPASAARLAPGDRQRVGRALEVWRASGRPLSAFHSGRFDKPARADSGPADTLLFSLEPQDRSGLHARIAQRFEAMLDGALPDELRALRARGDLHPELPSMRCVGYRQGWAVLDALAAQGHPAAVAGPLPPAARARWAEEGAAATRQLAKRQMTWLRSLPWRHVIAAETPAEAVADTLADALDARR